MNFTEAQVAFRADRAELEARGVSWQAGAEPAAYIPDAFKRDYRLAMDAIPAISTDPNSAVPAMLTTMIDPEVYKILFAPNKGAEILGEVRKGSWLDETAMFPVVEWEGEVSSYGDYSRNGRAGANTNWPQRQSYLFQVVPEWGERELERAGLARINWVSEVNASAAWALNKFLNLTYHYGVSGLQNYGLLNDPNLSAALTPGTKAAGNGNVWFFNGSPNATPNEVYNDILSMYETLVAQMPGLISMNDRMVLVLPPASEPALGFENSFGLTTNDMLKKNFPNLRVESDPLYGKLSSANPSGVAAGNFVQLIVEEVEGQKTGYCAFNEKMRAHTIIRDLSSFKQKQTSGSWGAVLRMPMAVVSMVGV